MIDHEWAALRHLIDVSGLTVDEVAVLVQRRMNKKKEEKRADEILATPKPQMSFFEGEGVHVGGV